MDSQKDLAWKMRGILTDWLIQVHMRFRLLPEAHYLAVNMGLPWSHTIILGTLLSRLLLVPFSIKQF